jgi:signal transduction histidine kinase
MDDADLNLALRAVLFGAVGTAGQRCTTTRRLFLQRNIAPAMTEALVKAYRQVPIGDPLDGKTLMGPLVNARAVEDMMRGLRTVREQGGEVIYGGRRREGCFVEPTLAYAGKGRIISKEVDISYLICETERELREDVPPAVRLELQLTPGLPPLAADPSQLQQLVIDLVKNAREAIEPGEPGTITVRAGIREIVPADIRAHEEIEPGAYVEIEVRDTGCGMDEATMARIFDPFFTTKFPGRGLGLAAVSGIARSHGGVVRVNSTPGHGSSFQVLLPAR